MISVGSDAAVRIGADPFAFVLAVTFAASTSVLSPIGYQTNLMVYGPGDYRLTGFFRADAPLQVVLAVVTTLGIAATGACERLTGSYLSTFWPAKFTG